MCTQRTGASRPPSPATGRTSRSERRSRRVSIARSAGEFRRSAQTYRSVVGSASVLVAWAGAGEREEGWDVNGMALRGEGALVVGVNVGRRSPFVAGPDVDPNRRGNRQQTLPP